MSWEDHPDGIARGHITGRREIPRCINGDIDIHHISHRSAAQDGPGVGVNQASLITLKKEKNMKKRIYNDL